MTQRAFLTTPTKWSNVDGTLTPEARRFLHSMFKQLGGEQPINFASIPEIEAIQRQLDRTLFFVVAIP